MTLEKILRYIVITGVFFIPFIPFIVSAGMFFPFITGKNFTFRVIAELVFAAWLILAYLSPAYRPKRSYILWAFGALVAVIAVADLLSPNVLKSFWSNFERMEGWVTLIHLFGYFLAVSSVLAAEKLWIRLASVSVAASVFMSFYGLLQLAGKLEIHQSGTRLDATLGNAAYMAVYMIFHIFFTALLLAYARGRNVLWAQWILGAVLALEVVILFYTETRGAMLGLIGGTVLALLAYAIGEGGKARTYAFGGLAGMVLLIGGFLLVKDSSFITSSGPLTRLASISLDEGRVRFMVWGMAWQGFTESPKTMLIGSGQESFNYVFNKYYNPGMYAQEPWFDRAHNVFMDWLTAGGALGLLSYLALFGASLYYLWLYRREGKSPFANAERAIMTGLLAAYFVHNVFVFDNLVSWMLFASLLAYLHARATGFSLELPRVDRSRENLALRFAAPAVLVALVATLYFVNVKGIVQAQTLLRAMSPQESGIDRNLTLFKEAYDAGWIGKQEVAEQFLMGTFQVQNSDAAADLKQRFAQSAVETMAKEIERTPNDARLLIFMTTIYNGLGQADKALEYGERAYESSPTKQYTIFELANVHMNKGNTERALELAKKAHEIEPEYREARIFYASVLTLAGKHAEVDALLEPIGGVVGANDNRLLNALVRAGRHAEVVKVWEARAKESTDAQTWVSMAAAYLGAGQRTEAIGALQKAIELNPEFKQQGEFYISEIQAGRTP